MTTTAQIVRAGLSGPGIGAKASLSAAPATVRYSFLLFVFTFPFQFLELPYLTGDYFSLANLTGVIFFVFYVFHLRVPFKKTIPGIPHPMGWFLVYFLTYILGGLFLEEHHSWRYFLRFTTVTQLLVFLWCASNLFKDPKLAKSCLISFSLAAVILATGTLLHVPGFVAEVGKRATAFDMNPNRTASLMVSAAVILIGFCLNESHWSLNRKLLVLISGLPLIALLVSTGSRAGIGSMVIGTSAFFFVRGRLKRKITACLLATAGIAVIIAFAMSDPLAWRRWELFLEEGHTAGRDVIWENALTMIVERPVFGWGRVGFDELGFRLGLMGSRDAHNLVLYLMLEVGVLGTVPFLIGLSLCLLAAWKARRGSLGMLPLALLTSALSMMMTHTGLTAKTFWLFLALALGTAAAPETRIRIRTGTAPHMIPYDVRLSRARGS